ncbi:thioredoxin family protein [Alkalihalobacterium chitinilyticum]|uniref:Thioredoxin family protein n=1 Tax=Alkalihalobacterium chitinilyticum TaxID=2980103 RepID=A0ABT5V944_9BACI|nr:thioredoxin family protein [Alkalihalobacterium chitinilyticum]MDE5411857.1 thioredoxin family protein [Alkalihalobacterium chitinilyticum]
MKEISRQQLIQMLGSQVGVSLVYFYSPFCGTCKLATKMLEVITTEIYPTLQISKCNINAVPDVAQSLKIKSVPLLLIMKHGEIVEEIYAFRSIEYLDKILEPY